MLNTSPRTAISGEHGAVAKCREAALSSNRLGWATSPAATIGSPSLVFTMDTGEQKQKSVFSVMYKIFFNKEDTRVLKCCLKPGGSCQCAKGQSHVLTFHSLTVYLCSNALSTSLIGGSVHYKSLILISLSRITNFVWWKFNKELLQLTTCEHLFLTSVGSKKNRWLMTQGSMLWLSSTSGESWTLLLDAAYILRSVVSEMKWNTLSEIQ